MSDRNTMINIRVDVNLKAKLTKLAETNQRSLSDYVRLQLEDIVQDQFSDKGGE